MTTVIKKASVKYTPNVGNVMDTISASCNGEELQKKDFYIYPQINWGWKVPTVFTRDEKTTCSVTPKIGGCDSIDSGITIKDHTKTIVFEKESYTIKNNTAISFDYTPDDSKGTQAQFTIIYELNDTETSVSSEWINITEDDATYGLSIKNPPLVSGVENTIEFSTESKAIAVGEVINFKSKYGLKADGTLKEAK